MLEFDNTKRTTPQFKGICKFDHGENTKCKNGIGFGIYIPELRSRYTKDLVCVFCQETHILDYSALNNEMIVYYNKEKNIIIYKRRILFGKSINWKVF